MSEIILNNKNVKVFLSNGFKYEGKVISHDNTFLKIIDKKTKEERIFPLTSIVDIIIIENGRR